MTDHLPSPQVVECRDCAQCGMCCEPGEYHPYAACLMFIACRNGITVRSNLVAVVEYGMGLATPKDQP